jgi:hypothetical protein
MVMRISVFLVAMLLLMQGCSPMPIREWPALEGRVLDAQTGEPIEGALVVARWIGHDRYSNTQCFHVAVAETDAYGRYHMAPWSNEQGSAYLIDQRQSIGYVYRKDYWESELTQERESYRRGVYFMESNTRDSAERLRYLRKLVNAVACGEHELDERNARYKWLTGIYAEAKNTMKTDSDREVVENIRYYSAEMLAHPAGTSTSYQERQRLIGQYMKEHFPW